MATSKVGIVVNPKKPEALVLAEQISGWLSSRSIDHADTTRKSFEQVAQKAGLLVCLGGDGTLLDVAHRLKTYEIPVLGVNLGKVGFLTEVKKHEVLEEIELFLNHKSVIEERLMLRGKLLNGRKECERDFTVLNDFVISREGLSRMLHLNVFVGSEKLTGFSGDGIIVATPTGSTAYSLSAGGAVVHPKLAVTVITPICPHSSSLRSMVVDAEEKITVRLRGDRDSAKALLTADGQENAEIDDSYSVEITKCESTLKLVKSSQRSYFATLRENFKFPA